MNDFTFYFVFGWEHIVSWDALDHLLFLTALVAAYMVTDWKQLLFIVTGFTIGHSVSLALSFSGKFKVSSEWVEFLIPVTIIATALLNLFQRPGQLRKPGLKIALAIVFGLVHGLGFANTLKFVLAGSESIGSPLLGFTLGIEIGQVAVVSLLLIFCFVIVNKFRLPEKYWRWILSVPCLLVSVYMAGSRMPI